MLPSGFLREEHPSGGRSWLPVLQAKGRRYSALLQVE